MTWITGQLPAPLTQIQIDVIQYGSPLPWTSRVIPTHFTNYNWVNLILDVAFWAVIAFLITTSARVMERPKQADSVKQTQ
ncbi:MAG: hypothetical protein NTY03_06965 [Candidatus Bathyarchaeota archaeon]|nr:hypothetical protein [Candidatus Bathyarchaeota archaeon]